MSKANADIDGLLPHVRKTVQEFQQLFPDFDVVSGYRSPTYNKGVGGAKQSQHTHRNAFDFNPRAGVSDERKADAVNWLRSQGANGFGTYDATGKSFHADFRSTPAVWGPNRSRTSLDRTPSWFQDFAQNHFSGAPKATQFATIPPGSIPTATPAAQPRQVAPGATQVPALPQRPAGAVPLPPSRPEGLLPGMKPGLVQQIAAAVAPQAPQAPVQAPQAPVQPPGQDRRGWPYQSLWEVAKEGVTDLFSPTPTPAPTPAPIAAPQATPTPPVPAEPPRQVRNVAPQVQVIPGAPVQGPELPPADNPLVVRGIRPQSADPLPPADNPLVVRGIRPQRPEAMNVPLPPQRPSNDQLFPQLPERALSALPQPVQPQRQGSTPTIWGANWHGPESGWINRAQMPPGTPYPEVWTGPSPYQGIDPFAGGGQSGGILGLLRL